jgi:transcriptional regulator GlxA family with amidase domain
VAGTQIGAGVNRRTLLIGGGSAVGLGALALATSRSSAVQGASVPDFGNRIPVAFLMDNGAVVIDFAGPWEVFQDSGNFHLFTVARTADELQTTGNFADGRRSGLRIRPDYTLANAPQPKIIVMGAQMGSDDPDKIAWIRKAAANADVVMSVCTGAFLLASTGLLDGLKATTHHGSYDRFAQKFPKVTLVRGRRFVDNGKFVTAGGLTSGIDAALHVSQRYLGLEATEDLAGHLEHFSQDWKTGASQAV